MIYVWRDWRFLGEAKYLGLPTRGGVSLRSEGERRKYYLDEGGFT